MPTATSIAEEIVDRFSRGDIDLDELEKTIAAAISKETIRINRNDASVVQYNRLKESPERWEKRKAKLRDAQRVRRARDPELARQKERERRQRWREANPEVARELNRAKAARMRANDPVGAAERERRKGFRRVSAEYREKVLNEIASQAKKLVPAGYPKHVRDDIVQSVVVAFTDGKFPKTDVRDAVKKATTAYNRMFDSFKTKSLDAIVPGTDSLRLIDTLSSDHAKF